MNVTRFAAAPPYKAPGHHEMSMLRLQGQEAGPSSRMWLGTSHFLPGGHTDLVPSPCEKVYVVLDGEITLDNGGEEAVLGPWDSCRFAPGEARRLTNRTNKPATVMLVMAIDPGDSDAR
jgi:mannose-6-phosphate isomerase-like protein (cupin superfamily)